MDPQTLKEYIDVLRYALDSLWPYMVALGFVAPLASKRVREAAIEKVTRKPKDPNATQ